MWPRFVLRREAANLWREEEANQRLLEATRGDLAAAAHNTAANGAGTVSIQGGFGTRTTVSNVGWDVGRVHCPAGRGEFEGSACKRCCDKRPQGW